MFPVVECDIEIREFSAVGVELKLSGRSLGHEIASLCASNGNPDVSNLTSAITPLFSSDLVFYGLSDHGILKRGSRSIVTSPVSSLIGLPSVKLIRGSQIIHGSESNIKVTSNLLFVDSPGGAGISACGKGTVST